MNKEKIFIYSLTKYVELGVMALVLLHFAREAGPEVYGNLSFFLVLISYSAFSALGVNASYVKQYSISAEEKNRSKLTALNFGYNLILALLVLIAIIFLVAEHSYSLAMICSLNLVRGMIQSILRAELRVYSLSLFNTFFSLIYVLAYFLIIVSEDSYEVSKFLDAWALALFIAFFIGFLLVSPAVTCFKNYSIDFIHKNVLGLLKVGILLFWVNLGNTIFLSLDRVLLNFYSAQSDTLGYYQFAENLATIFHMGTNALLFFLVPVYMRQLSEGIISVDFFKFYFYKFFLFWTIPFIVFVIVCCFLIKNLFSDYNDSIIIFILLSINKFICLILFIPTTLLTVSNQEKLIIKYYAFFTLLMFFFQSSLITFFIDYIEYLPIVSMVLVSFMLVLLNYEKVDIKINPTFLKN